MRILFLLVPVALAAAIGGFWYTSATLSQSPKASRSDPLPQGSQALFTHAERSLRAIMRHGDEGAIKTLNASLDAIGTELAERKRQGFSVADIESLLSQYRQDSAAITKNIEPRMRELRLYDRFERDNEQTFRTAIDQIGLYELKTAYDDLEKSRSEYIKKPSAASKERYMADADKIKRLIAELYLDSTIETPLYAYIDNHKLYLETITSAYEATDIERVNRLRASGYALKTELQLLPVL